MNWGNKEMVKAIEWIYVGSLMALRIMIILSWEHFCWLYKFSLPRAESMGYKQTYIWHLFNFIPVKSVHNRSRGISRLAKKAVEITLFCWNRGWRTCQHTGSFLAVNGVIEGVKRTFSKAGIGRKYTLNIWWSCLFKSLKIIPVCTKL